LKAFTESFNSGFGLGFTRGKSDSNYALSGISGQSGSSARTEKRKESSATDSAAIASGVRSPRIQAIKYEDLVELDARPLSAASSQVPLRLRPEKAIANIATVSAEPHASSADTGWRHGGCGGSESSDDDMVIMRETELSIHHDRAPILRPASAYAM
jgi:hypothetical protein